jgi:hypothetical protein
MGRSIQDIRVTTYGDKTWQLEPIPKAARKALEALNFSLPESKNLETYSPN